jgi:Spy/CpxP family protein refolding chaperone
VNAQEVTMLGFLIGFASLAGLVAVLRAGRRGGGCGGRGWHGHHHGWHGHHGRGGWGGGGGGGHWLRFAFERLDTTPGQEKEIKAAVEELMGKISALKGEGQATRQDVANALRNDSIDENMLAELFSRHDDKLREAHKAFADAFGRIHGALDAEQRKRLADFIAGGGLGRGFGAGPYRGWV